MKNNKKNSIFDIIKYRFDNFVSRGTRGIVTWLFVVTIIFVVTISIPIIRIENNDYKILWDNFATVINAWLPFSEDAETYQNGHIVLIVKLVIAIFGLLLTSVLIGIISEVIESKVRKIRQAKSKVIETNHIVVIGYDENNHTLLRELINATNKKRKILIIDDKSKEEIEEDIHSNIRVPKNIKIIIRTLKLWDIEGLKRCNIEESSAIVISPMSDITTLKVVFAVKNILKKFPNSKTHIVSGINNSEHKLIFSHENDIMFHIDSLIAKMIATSNHQIGLSKVLMSILSFEGSEFYLSQEKKLIGKTFGELTKMMVNAVPVGIARNGKFIIAHQKDEKLLDEDELLYYTETRDDLEFVDVKQGVGETEKIIKSKESIKPKKDNILILGCNNKIDIIYKDFGNNIGTVTIAGVSKKQIELLKVIIKKRKDIKTKIVTDNLSLKENLITLVNNLDHVIILKDENVDNEISDVNNMLLYLRLIKVRELLKKNYTIITELNSDENRELIEIKYSNDFIVSSNITAMMLAQMAEEIRLRPLFFELLSEDGANVHLKGADEFVNHGGLVSNIRMNLLQKGYIFLGYITKEGNDTKYIYNPNSRLLIDFKEDDRLILLGK